MDSPGGSSVSSLGASEATKLLKEMLKMGGLGNSSLGKSRSESSGKLRNKHEHFIWRALLSFIHTCDIKMLQLVKQTNI